MILEINQARLCRNGVKGALPCDGSYIRIFMKIQLAVYRDGLRIMKGIPVRVYQMTL